MVKIPAIILTLVAKKENITLILSQVNIIVVGSSFCPPLITGSIYCPTKKIFALLISANFG